MFNSLTPSMFADRLAGSLSARQGADGRRAAGWVQAGWWAGGRGGGGRTSGRAARLLVRLLGTRQSSSSDVEKP